MIHETDASKADPVSRRLLHAFGDKLMGCFGGEKRVV
jgi:hypothetical protein